MRIQPAAKYGLRQASGFSFVAVSVLALGVGVNTAIFSVIGAVLQKPLPHPEADLLVWIRNAQGKFQSTLLAVTRLLVNRAQRLTRTGALSSGQQRTALSLVARGLMRDLSKLRPFDKLSCFSRHLEVGDAHYLHKVRSKNRLSSFLGSNKELAIREMGSSYVERVNHRYPVFNRLALSDFEGSVKVSIAGGHTEVPLVKLQFQFLTVVTGLKDRL